MTGSSVQDLVSGLEWTDRRHVSPNVSPSCRYRVAAGQKTPSLVRAPPRGAPERSHQISFSSLCARFTHYVNSFVKHKINTLAAHSFIKPEEFQQDGSR